MSEKGLDEGVVREITVPDMGNAHTVYANGFVITGQMYGHQLIFTLKNGPEDPAVPVSNVHLSPELLKVVGRLIRKQVLQIEEKIGGPVQLPDALLDELGVRGLEE